MCVSKADVLAALDLTPLSDAEKADLKKEVVDAYAQIATLSDRIHGIMVQMKDLGQENAEMAVELVMLRREVGR